VDVANADKVEAAAAQIEAELGESIHLVANL
jgi:hypothetical protein